MCVNISLPNSHYFFPELESVFKDSQKVYVDNLEYDGEICQIAQHNICVTSNPKRSTCSKLYQLAIPSKVGKGSQTVLDEEVRRSREYSGGSGIQWNSEFVDHVTARVSGGLKKTHAGTLVKLTPHKLIVYGEGDFFSEHMDSVHTPGQNMTAVVELSTFHQGGDFVIEGTNYSNGEARLIVFDHDQMHEVTSVYSGYRISITFDLVVDPLTETGRKAPDITGVVERLAKMGVERFGFFATRRYLTTATGEYQELKGDDARLVELFRPYVSDVTKVNLFTDDCNDWYLESVWDFKNSGTECGILMFENENDPPEYSEPMIPSKTAPPDRWNPTVGVEEHIVKDKYCLGDVFPLWSPHTPKLVKSGKTDVHLGNEGFDGEVHENVFIIMKLLDPRK